MDNNPSLFPTGLSKEEFELLNKHVSTCPYKHLKDLLPAAEDYCKTISNVALSKPMVNSKLASGILDIFKKLSDEWETVAESARPWLCGAMCYFTSSNDSINDLDSSIGFEDDLEVLNACLRYANKENLSLNPEDFDNA